MATLKTLRDVNQAADEVRSSSGGPIFFFREFVSDKDGARTYRGVIRLELPGGGYAEAEIHGGTFKGRDGNFPSRPIYRLSDVHEIAAKLGPLFGYEDKYDVPIYTPDEDNGAEF